MGIREKARAAGAWLKEEGSIAVFVANDGAVTDVHDGVSRWKRLLRMPGQWAWRERDWLIKAAIGAAGVLIGKYLLK
ncbi:MAG TPA: hypothetical protein VGK37_12775 [Casimicrobiaceae bacterium]